MSSETSDTATIQTGRGLLSFPRSQILRIEKDEQDANELRLFADALGRREFSQAFARLSRITDEEFAKQADELILRSRAEIVAQAASVSAADAVALANYLSRRTPPVTVELQLLHAQFLGARGDDHRALLALESVGVTHLSEPGRQQGWLPDYLAACASRALDDNNSTVGLRAIRLLGLVTPQSMEAGLAGVAAALSQCDLLVIEGRYTGAMDVLAGSVAPYAPGLACSKAIELLDQARTRIAPDDLMALVQRAANGFHGTPVAHEVAAYLAELATALARDAQLDSAHSAAVAVQKLDADAAASLVNQIELERRLAALDQLDRAGRYELAIWARERGLNERARGLFRQVRADEKFRENADLQLLLMEAEEEKAAFGRLIELFEQEEFEQVPRTAEEFRKTHPQSPLGQRALNMSEIAKYRMTTQERRRPALAEALYQNAERLVLQGRYAEAWDTLNRLSTDYEGAAAAGKAPALREEVRRKASQAGIALSETSASAQDGSTTARLEAARLAREELRAMLQGMRAGQRGALAPR